MPVRSIWQGHHRGVLSGEDCPFISVYALCTGKTLSFPISCLAFVRLTSLTDRLILAQMHKLSIVPLLLWMLPLQASDLETIQAWLRRPIIDTNLPLAEVQAYAQSRVPLIPEAHTAKQWAEHAERMRRETLQRVVFRGEAARWQTEKTRVEWLERIEGGPGYSMRKLRYEAVPGLWIPALLYEPHNLSGKVPVIMNVNGHEGIGKAVAYKQIRCINLVKRGMLVLNPEWIGMGQLGGTGYQHYRMNQLDLCGTSGLAPFYLAMKRGLDILLAHQNADPERVGVSGLSGGGWQTIFISALDTRVKLCNPVAGYSSFRTRARFLSDLGDSEQTPCDLATVVDYTHLTAMLAPRPTLLTYNFKDNCCFASPHALEPLWEAAAPIFELYGKEENLRAHINYDPGDHNFGLDNREAFYRIVGEHFFAGQDFVSMEILSDAEVKSNTVLNVALPTNNATFNSLALDLSKDLPRQPKLPASESAGEKWQQDNRAKLRDLVRAKHSRVVAEQLQAEEKSGTRAVFWRLRVDDAWTVPAVELSPHNPQATVIVVADAGRQNVANEVRRFLTEGKRVLAVDPFYFGESKIRSHDYLFALLLAAIGDRPLGVQAGQLAAIAGWCQSRYRDEPVIIAAIGPRSALFSLIAAGLEDKAIGGLELNESLGSLKEVIEQNWGVTDKPELFCFGLLEALDIKQLVALVTPRPAVFRKPSERLKTELATLTPWCEMLGTKLQMVE